MQVSIKVQRKQKENAEKTNAASDQVTLAVHNFKNLLGEVWFVLDKQKEMRGKGKW